MINILIQYARYEHKSNIKVHKSTLGSLQLFRSVAGFMLYHYYYLQNSLCNVFGKCEATFFWRTESCLTDSKISVITGGVSFPPPTPPSALVMQWFGDLIENKRSSSSSVRCRRCFTPATDWNPLLHVAYCQWCRCFKLYASELFTPITHHTDKYLKSH